MMENRPKKFFFLIPIVVLLVLPFIVMLLWNNVITGIFEIKSITYLQAIGLFILSRILFGSFGLGNRPKPPFDKHYKDRFLKMTDEEKSKMAEEWKKRTSCEK